MRKAMRRVLITMVAGFVTIGKLPAVQAQTAPPADPASTSPGASSWSVPAPEQLPGVTVRWEDPAQQDVFIVQGQSYECRVSTLPARILSLKVGGKELLGPGGIRPAIIGSNGQRFVPAPASFTPSWNVWRRRWVPADSPRARMNVWSAGPYFWDAHLLDIPMLPEEALKTVTMQPPTPPAAQWAFQKDTQGWSALHDCQATAGTAGFLHIHITGDDPYLGGPQIQVPGPVVVNVRMRSRQGGGGAIYWTTAAGAGFTARDVVTFPVRASEDWQDYKVVLPVKGVLHQLRIDPPGDSGDVDISTIQVTTMPPISPALRSPLRGEIVFYAYPDQLRIELRVDPAASQKPPQAAVLGVDAFVTPMGIRAGRFLGVLGGGVAGILGPPAGEVKAPVWTAPLSADRHDACWVIRPLAQGETAGAAFQPDLAPLPDTAVSVTNGRWLGYDPVSGLYRVQAIHGPGFDFDGALANPGRRVAVALHMQSAAQRSILVKCEAGLGDLEAAVLADQYGFPLPVPVQVCKNFSGELEEPDDTAFGDSYFPITLEPGQARDFQVLNLIQGWGNHPLKQVSSIRFFNIYWHLSTGASESTCWTHNWMQIGDSGVIRIPDFRPMSGPFWPTQPQHDCQQWPGFLQCNDGKIRLVYEKTVFNSISPNLARFTMFFHTSDDCATASLSVMEIPQTDEMRTFVHIHYEWQKPESIQGDARTQFRWLNIFEKNLPAALLWSDPDGSTHTIQAEPGQKPLLLGQPMAAQTPFAASAGTGDHYSCLALVRSFQAQLGGHDFTQPALSAQFGPRDGSWWLTVPTDTLSLHPGDHLDADVMLMPEGEPAPPTLKPERERTEHFGMGLPLVKEVSVGQKLSDFPATIRAQDEVASFTLTGGSDLMPLIVSGFRAWEVPMLWRDNVWQNQQVDGGDGYQVDADGQGGYRFTFLAPLRAGQEGHFMVTRASCSTGIRRMYDDNGFVSIEAPIAGDFQVKAPVIFGPGASRFTPGSPVASFTGHATVIRAMPVGFTPKGGPATVECDATGATAHVHGAGDLTFNQLQPGASYQVNVNGKTRAQVAAGGSIQIHIPGPDTVVVLSPSPVNK